MNGVVVDTSPVFKTSKDEIGGHGRNLYHFINCILHDEKPNFVPQHGVDMIKILTAIYKSAETGREVIL